MEEMAALTDAVNNKKKGNASASTKFQTFLLTRPREWEERAVLIFFSRSSFFSRGHRAVVETARQLVVVVVVVVVIIIIIII